MNIAQFDPVSYSLLPEVNPKCIIYLERALHLNSFDSLRGRHLEAEKDWQAIFEDRQRFARMDLESVARAKKVLGHFTANLGSPDQMPPTPQDTSMLIDALSMRLGGSTRADAWRHIGIPRNDGRRLLGRNHSKMFWPIWRALFSETFC